MIFLIIHEYDYTFFFFISNEFINFSEFYEFKLKNFFFTFLKSLKNKLNVTNFEYAFLTRFDSTHENWGGGQNLERRNSERPMFQNF